MPCVHNLLTDPDIDDPLNQDLAQLYRNDRKLYENNVKDYTKKFAM